MNVVSHSPTHRIGNQCVVTAQFGISFNAIDYNIPQSTVLSILLCNDKPSFYFTLGRGGIVRGCSYEPGQPG